MNCCGQKRAQLTQARAPSKHAATELSPPAIPAHRRLIYQGDQVLTLRGTVTGRLYHLTHHGMELEVDYADSFALLAEARLRLAPS